MKYLTFVFFSVLICAISFMNQLAAQTPELATKLDSISYALGYDLGNSLEKTGVTLNTDQVYQALTDVQTGTPQLTETQKKALLQTLQQQITEQSKPKPAVAIGEAAPEISLPTPTGETLQLSDLKGKIVLIDFWASWCRPCRMENPAVVKAYHKYKDKGFDILSVSLDRNKDHWLAAIAKDGLEWHHVSDLKFWQSEAAKTYGVHSIPYTVLIDTEGKVIAQRLRGKSLDQKLAELLGE